MPFKGFTYCSKKPGMSRKHIPKGGLNLLGSGGMDPGPSGIWPHPPNESYRYSLCWRSISSADDIIGASLRLQISPPISPLPPPCLPSQLKSLPKILLPLSSELLSELELDLSRRFNHVGLTPEGSKGPFGLISGLESEIVSSWENIFSS